MLYLCDTEIKKRNTMRATSTINRNFKIKVFGRVNGKKINTLVGVSGLIKLIGADFAEEFVERAFNSTEDKCVCKLRRGIKVTFYCF